MRPYHANTLFVKTTYMLEFLSLVDHENIFHSIPLSWYYNDMILTVSIARIYIKKRMNDPTKTIKLFISFSVHMLSS